MNDKNPAAEWLRTQGVAPEKITSALANVDQIDAWIASVAPIATALNESLVARDFSRALHMSQHIEEKLGELDVRSSSPAGSVIVALLRDCATAVAKLDEAGIDF